jgi:hypothetical protein
MEDQKRLFWEAIDKVNQEDLQKNEKGNVLTLEKATELSVWLHTEF